MAESKYSILKMTDLEVFQALKSVADDCKAVLSKGAVKIAKDFPDLPLEDAGAFDSDPIVSPLFKANAPLTGRQQL